MYASSSRRGSSLTWKTPPRACGRIRKGAIIRGGVCCHRGLSAASVSCSGSLDGVVVENVHAEVRTRAAFEVWAGRRDDDAVDSKQRNDLLDAIGEFEMYFEELRAPDKCGRGDAAGVGKLR
jgi:hypothetical protein